MILRRLLTEQAEANGFGERLMNISTRGNRFDTMASLPDQSAFRRRADYEDYLKQLSDYPPANAQQLDIDKHAVAGGFVQPCDAIRGIDKAVAQVAAGAPETSPFYAPFTRAKPDDLSDREWATMQARAKALIANAIDPAYSETADFLQNTYIPACRSTIGASALPDGRRHYA